METGCILALVDPRDHRIFHVELMRRGVHVNEHVADIVAGARSGQRTPLLERVHSILAADYDAPQAVVLQAEADEADEVAWARLLTEMGSELTNLEAAPSFAHA